MANKEQFGNLVKTKMRYVLSDSLITSFRVWMEVGDVMSKDVITIPPDATGALAAKRMSENNISCLIVVDSGVVDNGSIAGIITETDFLKRVVAREKDLDTIKVMDIMSSPVESIPSNLSVLEASRIMKARHVKRLPILKERRLVGIVTQTDLIRVLTSYGMWRDIAEIMTKDVAGIQKNRTVTEAAKVMDSRNISCVVVLEKRQVVGIFTERDLLERIPSLQRNSSQIKIEEVMSSPVASIPSDYSVFSASRIMEEMNIRRLVVMEDGQLCGIVTQTNILDAVKGKLQEEEEKSFRLLEKSESSLYTVDLEGKTTYVNPAFMKLLEVSDPGELINQPFLPQRFWFDPQEGARFLRELKRGFAEVRELTLKTSRGKRVDVTLFSVPTKNIHGEINGSQGTLYDITPKKELVALRKAEKALKQNEERYRRLTDAVTDYIFTVRLEDGRPVETIHSSSSVAVTSYTPEELAADPHLWINMVHPEDRQAVCQQASQCLSGQNIKPLEHRIVRKDGAIRWVKSTLVRHFDLQGKLLSYDGLLQDITERKQAEEALQTERDNAQKYLDVAEVILLVIGTDQNVSLINRKGCEILEYREDEIIGKNWLDNFVPEKVRNELKPIVSKVLKGQVELFEYHENPVLTKSGKERIVAWHNTILHDEKGEIEATLSCGEDITDRKKTEEKLKEYHNNLEALVKERTEQLAKEKELLSVTLSSMGDGVIVVDAEKRITLFNKVAESLTGWKFDDVQGKPIDEVFRVINERTKNVAESPIDKVLSSGKVEAQISQDSLVAKDGSECPISASVAPIRNSSGTVIGIVMVLRDVSQEREIDRMKKDFVSSVSHELRTPLTSIKAYTETMLSEPDMPEQAKRQSLAVIDEESNRLANLIEDLLEVSRIEAGNVKIAWKGIDVAAVTNRVLSTLEPLADKKNIQLKSDVSDKLPVFYSDESKVRSVFTNLVNNAIKFTPEQGRVSVCVQCQGQELVIRVSDTGMGIPKEALPKIFERFYRVHRPGTQIQGTGLGLAIVKEIVMMHNGRIEVESEADRGTTFTVFLPLEAKSISEVSPAEQAHAK